MSQLNRRLLFIGGILAAVAIIAVITNNRHDLDQANGERQPSCTPSEISNSKSQIPPPAGAAAPADAPLPAITPLTAEQAKQH